MTEGELQACIDLEEAISDFQDALTDWVYESFNCENQEQVAKLTLEALNIYKAHPIPSQLAIVSVSIFEEINGWVDIADHLRPGRDYREEALTAAQRNL